MPQQKENAMNRKMMIEELKAFIRHAPDAPRETLIEDILKRMSDTALVEVYEATEAANWVQS
jgi:hypothetical protein